VVKINEKCENSTLYLSFREGKDGRNWVVNKCMGWKMKGAQKQKI
jgi:hypothetical protein